MLLDMQVKLLDLHRRAEIMELTSVKLRFWLSFLFLLHVQRGKHHIRTRLWSLSTLISFSLTIS